MTNSNHQYLFLNDISTYRQVLMGLGIFGVMFSHWFGFQGINNGVPYVLSDFIVKLVFTEGFLFLSGFGLYYSFSSKPDVLQFYKRRLSRLYIPFLILSFPLYLFFLLYRSEYDFNCFILQISSVYFWINGNYGGMWYVSLSLLLYLLFPLLYRYIYSKSSQTGVMLRTFTVILIVYFMIGLIQRVDPIYYDKISIGVGKIVFFMLGMLFAFEVKNVRLSSTDYVCCVIALGVIYVGLTVLRLFFHMDNDIIKSVAGIFQKLFFMPFICFLFNFLKDISIARNIIIFFDWFGKYSLELYILHLHFFLFFKFGFLSDTMPSMWQATIAILLALMFCIPTKVCIASMSGRLVG